MKNKIEYVSPEAKVVLLESVDVIRTSGPLNDLIDDDLLNGTWIPPQN